MITKPKIEFRAEQTYAAIRAKVAVPFGSVLGDLWGEVQTWLASQEAAMTGAALIRYLTTDMSKELDIEVGFLVAEALPGKSRISAGILPAGRYAVLSYTGPYQGDGIYRANIALIEWAKQNHIVWQMSTQDNVEWWGGRAEIYLTDPEKEPDSKKWRTELVFLVADGETAGN